MMRPQRDTRFSPDKTPYKTNVGIYFRHSAGKDIHAPGLYLHFDPAEVFIGVGMWRPDGPSLAAVRKRIDQEPAAWKRARDAKAFRSYFDLDGSSLKRPPRGYDAGHPFIEDLKRKDHVGSCKMKLGDLFKPNFLSEVDKRFKASRGYVKFLCEALELPF